MPSDLFVLKPDIICYALLLRLERMWCMLWNRRQETSLHKLKTTHFNDKKLSQCVLYLWSKGNIAIPKVDVDIDPFAQQKISMLALQTSTLLTKVQCLTMVLVPYSIVGYDIRQIYILHITSDWRCEADDNIEEEGEEFTLEKNNNDDYCNIILIKAEVDHTKERIEARISASLQTISLASIKYGRTHRLIVRRAFFLLALSPFPISPQTIHHFRLFLPARFCLQPRLLISLAL